MRARDAIVVVALGLAACARTQPPPSGILPPPPHENALATLSGSVAVSHASPAGVAGTVVFLETLLQARPPAPTGVAEIHVRNGRFEPRVRVVQRGQRVTWTNLDPIFHGVFSYSRPNDFDLGVYAPNENRSTVLSAAGPVRFHCPIHVDESGVIFVTPGPHYTLSKRRAHYVLREVPPGRYWLAAWSDGWAAAPREITLHAGELAHADVVLRPEGE